MKKYTAILVTLLCLLILTGCRGDSALDQMGDTLGLSVAEGTVKSGVDTHSGTQGDGCSFTEVRFSDDSLQQEIEQQDDWQTIPLSDTLTALVYGTGSRDDSIGPYLTDKDGNCLFPEITHGYYWFKDRQAESRDGEDSPELLERASLNVTMAMYDIDTRTLYYCELDT
ncbi:MAG: hypothetical protein Q4F79_03495 [Eubacteriales bacterium]|nr:hypothetical protein [Eubacteriales bacterium]